MEEHFGKCIPPVAILPSDSQAMSHMLPINYRICKSPKALHPSSFLDWLVLNPQPIAHLLITKHSPVEMQLWKKNNSMLFFLSTECHRCRPGSLILCRGSRGPVGGFLGFIACLQASLYDTNPNNALFFQGEILRIYHTFCSVSFPKWVI